MYRARRWIDRLLLIASIAAGITLNHLGFGVGLIAAVVAGMILVWAAIAIYITPGPKTKHLVEKLKGRSR
jgi:hypothetical protein